jgi:GntR family transcriptional repressor for pyruvate dehydrogenase complex
MDIKPVKSTKVSELIFQQIKATILTGEMKPGDKLPSERELAERFQASRISVREALKNMETSGLLTIKPGTGVFVAEVSSKPMSEFLSSAFEIKKTSLDSLTEARMILEPSVARFACNTILPEELLKLEQNLEKASSIVAKGSPALEVDIEFHSLIVEATHNQLIALTMKTLLDTVQQMTSKKIDDVKWKIDIARHSVSCHRKILEAFRQGNPQEVYELMLDHILQIQRDELLIGISPRKGQFY